MNIKYLLRRIIPVVALLLLLPWPVAYGFQVNGASASTPKIFAAEAAAMPSWQAWGGSTVSVEPGTLFTIDLTEQQWDEEFTLILTNADKLLPVYRSMILQIQVYKIVPGEDGAFTDAIEQFDNPEIITFETLFSTFKLKSGARYQVSVVGGSVSLQFSQPNRVIEAPVFFLESASTQLTVR